MATIRRIEILPAPVLHTKYFDISANARRNPLLFIVLNVKEVAYHFTKQNKYDNEFFTASIFRHLTAILNTHTWRSYPDIKPSTPLTNWWALCNIARVRRGRRYVSRVSNAMVTATLSNDFSSKNDFILVTLNKNVFPWGKFPSVG